jgi:hypothetical protein
MTWQSFFQAPDLVKTASASDLDVNAEGALVIAGYRIDNPAAAWVSKASIKVDELRGSSVNKIASAEVDKACTLFGISDDMFEMHDVKGHSFIVKEAGMTAEFCILSEDSFNKAVQAVFEKRASAPYDFCRACAENLLGVQEAEGYSLAVEDMNRLQKMANRGNFNAQATKEAIEERATYAEVFGLNLAERNSLTKLANACSLVPREGNTVFPVEIVRCIDEFDRKYNLMHKLATHKVTPIEEIAYMTPEESLIKEASDIVEIDDVRTITKKPFMIPEYCDMMAKWASDNGYATTTEPEDILDCVSSMSESLREEFVQTFGNL